jgi:Co/Zn/Cd efflux system component
MSDCGCNMEAKNAQQHQVLITLLAINASMFAIEIVLGIASDSTALIADSLDMLADAIVYGIGLYAVGRPALAKIRAAQASGWFQIALGLAVLVDALRRLVSGSEPESLLMIGVGIAALIANLICLKLISKHRDGDVHMRASWIFSKNDVIANIGIIIAGGLVYRMDSSYPDIVIGVAIASIVIRGGIHIVNDARQERQITQRCG